MNTSHGMRNHKFYPIWNSMKARCYLEKDKSYQNYGGRGVSVCKEWRDSPVKFIQWLEDHNYGHGLEIDRINNNRNYSPENCRVVTKSQNQRNRRDNVLVIFNGVKKHIIDLAREHGIKTNTLRARISRSKMSVEEAVSFKFNSRRVRG